LQALNRCRTLRPEEGRIDRYLAGRPAATARTRTPGLPTSTATTASASSCCQLDRPKPATA